MYYALLWTCVGILIRSVYRIAEFAQGYDGKLRTTEAYFYALDSLPLFLAIAVWAVVWPPAYLRADLKYKRVMNSEYANGSAIPLKTQPYPFDPYAVPR